MRGFCAALCGLSLLVAAAQPTALSGRPALRVPEVRQVELDLAAVERVAREAIEARVPAQYALLLATIGDDRGKPFYTAAHIAALHQESISVDRAEAVSYIHDHTGAAALSGESATAVLVQNLDGHCGLFWGSAESKPYAEQLAALQDIAGRPLLSSWDIYRAHLFGLSIADVAQFRDTIRQNVLFVVPESDHNGVYLQKGYRDFLNALRSRRDVAMLFADAEYQVRNAIAAVPDLRMVVLSGHGDRCSLTLRKGNGEQGVIDTTDGGLVETLERQVRSIKVILYSCSNGEGGATAENLANYFSSCGNCAVFAGTEPVQVVKIRRRYPLRVTLTDRLGRDVTYAAGR